MPFVTKNARHYLPLLAEETSDPLHVGLFLSGGIDQKRHDDLVALGQAIRQSPRPVRCLWLRFRGESEESLLDALRAFGDALAGADSVQSVVFEGKVGSDELRCLGGFLSQNALRGVQFRRTDVDASTFALLRPFFLNAANLKVLDMSGNVGVGDEAMREVLGALLEGKARLETLSVGENNLDGGRDEDSRISAEGVASIAKFVSETRSLTSVTLRLRNLDDIGIGELALPVRRRDCTLRRLDLCGDYGNSGVKIFAEALKTNTSLTTISFGCYKSLTDVGGQALLEVVDPFSLPPPGESDGISSKAREWDHAKRSNHTLRSIYILDRPTVTVNKNTVTQLQSISTLDPHQTLQRKCWTHIEKNIDDISHLGLETKHMPHALAFVHQHGGMDRLFELVKSQNAPELFTNPSPEKERLSCQMGKLEKENVFLKELLERERERGEDLREENNYLRTLFERREDAKKCCLLPLVKLIEFWRLFVKALA